MRIDRIESVTCISDIPDASLGVTSQQTLCSGATSDDWFVRRVIQIIDMNVYDAIKRLESQGRPTSNAEVSQYLMDPANRRLIISELEQLLKERS